MSWCLSRFRAGDVVEVRSREEILATLDAQGCVDGLPFMPEMLRFCGRRFRVGAVAHKTCETAHHTYKARRLQTTVHLTGLRCDGSAHGGCQAECNLFWQDAWLKSVAEADQGSSQPRGDRAVGPAAGCTEEQLRASAQLPAEGGQTGPRYACQATGLFEATTALAWWDTRQYLRDVTTRNHSVGHVVRVLWLATLRTGLRWTPYGYRIASAFRVVMHRWLTGREIPDFQGVIRVGTPTPTGRLELQPGERVRIRSKEEIVRTLDEKGRNRGLYFDVEMAKYCGRVAVVRVAVTRILDEVAGTMLEMKQPCIMLEGVVCDAEYSNCRLMCPRAIPAYWREIWLERVEEPTGSAGAPETPACLSAAHRS